MLTPCVASPLLIALEGNDFALQGDGFPFGCETSVGVVATVAISSLRPHRYRQPSRGEIIVDELAAIIGPK